MNILNHITTVLGNILFLYSLAPYFLNYFRKSKTTTINLLGVKILTIIIYCMFCSVLSAKKNCLAVSLKKVVLVWCILRNPSHFAICGASPFSMFFTLFILCESRDNLWFYVVFPVSCTQRILTYTSKQQRMPTFYIRYMHLKQIIIYPGQMINKCYLIIFSIQNYMLIYICLLVYRSKQ